MLTKAEENAGRGGGVLPASACIFLAEEEVLLGGL